MGKYRKSITALFGAVVGWVTLVTVSEAGPISSAEWIAGAIALGTALGVYGITNETT